MTRLAVREIPRSGKPDELLDKYGISARHIVDAVKDADARALPVLSASSVASGRRPQVSGDARRVPRRGSAGSRVGAGRQAHRGVVPRSHLDDDAGGAAAEGGHLGERRRSSASRRGHPTARASRSPRRAATASTSIVVPAKGGAPTAVTSMPGDERWPSWTPDGRIVFAHRDDAPSGGPVATRRCSGISLSSRRSPGPTRGRRRCRSDRHADRRDVSARLARWQARRVRLRSRFDRRRRPVRDAGAGGRRVASRCRSAPRGSTRVRATPAIRPTDAT